MASRGEAEWGIQWVVVASRSGGRIFRRKYQAPGLTLVKELDNPLGRARNQALVSEKPGVSNSSGVRGAGRHALTGKKDPHEEKAVRFARELAELLDQTRLEGTFDGLVIAAEPHFMGLLRNAMGAEVKEKVLLWVKKDLAKTAEEDLPLRLGFAETPKRARAAAAATAASIL